MQPKSLILGFEIKNLFFGQFFHSLPKSITELLISIHFDSNLIATKNFICCVKMARKYHTLTLTHGYKYTALHTLFSMNDSVNCQNQTEWYRIVEIGIQRVKRVFITYQLCCAFFYQHWHKRCLVQLNFHSNSFHSLCFFLLVDLSVLSHS